MQQPGKCRTVFVLRAQASTTADAKKQQKMRSTAYGSFSLFGLIFVFAVGGSLIVTSYLLEPVAEFLYKKRGYKKYEQLEWTSNATLQLQRLAHEEAGFATWSNCTGTAPSTKADESLGSLNLTDPEHPVLKPSPLEEDTTDNTTDTTEVPGTTRLSNISQTGDTSSPTVTLSSLPLQFAEGSIGLPQGGNMAAD